MQLWRDTSTSDTVGSYLLSLLGALLADDETQDLAAPVAEHHARLKAAKRAREDAWEPVVLARGRVRFRDHYLNRAVQALWNALGAGLEWLRARIFAQPPSVTTRGMADTQRRHVTNVIGEAKAQVSPPAPLTEHTPKVEAALATVETARGEVSTARAGHKAAFRVERALREAARPVVKRAYGQLIDRFPNDLERVESYFPGLDEVRPEDEAEAEAPEEAPGERPDGGA